MRSDHHAGWVVVGLVCASLCSLSSCALIRLTGEVITFTGKVATTAVKTTTAVVGSTVKLGGGIVRRFSGRREVKLDKEGDSYFVEVKVNGRQRGRLVLDTGATNVQISARLAQKAGINFAQSEIVNCTLADGSVVTARTVTLKKLQVGSVTVGEINALVFEKDYSDSSDGLLGMSFLNHFIFEVDTRRDVLILKNKDE